MKCAIELIGQILIYWSILNMFLISPSVGRFYVTGRWPLKSLKLKYWCHCVLRGALPHADMGWAFGPRLLRWAFLANDSGLLCMRNSRMMKSTMAFLRAKGPTHTSEGQRHSIPTADEMIPSPSPHEGRRSDLLLFSSGDCFLKNRGMNDVMRRILRGALPHADMVWAFGPRLLRWAFFANDSGL